MTKNGGKVVLFLGAPGSGKGTQSAWLSQRLGLSHLSTGEILRERAREESAEGRALRKLLAAGSLVSDQMVCEAIEARLRRGVPESGIILDGFPRTVAQARWLDRTMKQLGLGAPLVLHLEVPREELIARLLARGEMEGREDDNAGSIARRFAAFDATFAPLVEHYRTAAYYRIDGGRRADEIARDLAGMVGSSERARAAA